MRPNRAIPLVALLSWACASPEHLGLAEPDVQSLANGAVSVFNPGPSSWSDTLGWKLVLERTITPPENGPGQLVRPHSIGVAADSSIIVNDDSGEGILLFAPDGRFVRQIGRHGSGPGEYGDYFEMDVRGDVIAIHECNASRAIMFSTNGNVLAQWSTQTDCAGVMSPVLDSNGEVWLTRYIRDNAEGVLAAVRWSSAGVAIDTVPLPPYGPRPPGWEADGGVHAIPFTAWELRTMSPDGAIWLGNSAEYRLVQVRNASDTIQMVEVAAARPMIPDSMRIAALAPYLANSRLKDVAKLEDVPTEQPYFTGMSIDENSQLWIHRVDAGGQTVTFDIINDEGHYLGSVPAPPGEFRRAVWRNARMYRVTENAAGVPVIEVYRVDRALE